MDVTPRPNPTQVPEDVLTPQDSLEQTTTVSVTPNANLETAAPGSGLGVAQPAPTTSVFPTEGGQTVQDLATPIPQKPTGPRFSLSRSLRRSLVATGALMAVISILVGGTLVYQKQHQASLAQTNSGINIKDQNVTLSAATQNTAPSSLRVGVATLFVNGDISAQGILRFAAGDNYAQLNPGTLTANQTYSLPDASGTICLDSNNCGYASTAELRALANLTASAALAAQAASGNKLSAGAGLTLTGDVLSNSGVLSVNNQTGPLTIQGTPNQVIATTTNGIVSLSLPQDIGTTSTPSFAGLSLTAPGSQAGHTICDNSNNCGYAIGVNALLQGGNSFGTNVVVGASDNAGLELITNNTKRLSITNNGAITVGGSTSDRVSFLAQLSGAKPLVFQGVTDDFFTTTLNITNPTSNRNITLPNADGTICLSSGNCSGAGGYGDILNGGNNFNGLITLGSNDNYGLNLKTNNVTRVTVSNTGATALLGNVTAAADAVIGTNATNRLTINSQIMGGTPLVFQGASSNAFTTSFVVTDPTANRTITLPNADGTICLSSGNCSGIGGLGDVLQGGNNFGGTMVLGTNDDFDLLLKTNGTTRLTVTNTGAATFSGDLAANGNIQLGATNTNRITLNGQVQGATPLVFQGATDNAYATYLLVTDPTANRTITLPNADGTICLSSGNCSTSGGVGDVLNGGNNFNGTMVLGTNDNFGFNFKTNNIERLTIGNTGLVTALGNFVVDGDTLLGASGANAVTIQATNLFAPNDLNIDTYTQYINTTTHQVGFGTLPLGTARVSVLATNGGDALTVNNGNGVGNIINLQDNGVNVFTVANGGVITARNNVDTPAAFLIQDAAGSTIVNVNTSDKNLSINAAPSSYTFTPSGPNLGTATGYVTGPQPQAVASGNFNGDGFADLVTVNLGSNAQGVSVFINNGNGTYTNKVDYNLPFGSSAYGVAATDFNNDGLDDIVVSTYYTPNLTVFINTGGGTFAPGVAYNATARPYAVATGDFNGDGFADIVSANSAGTTYVSVLLNNGNGTFAAKTDYYVGSGQYAVAAGDVNNDGNIDIVSPTDVGQMAVLLGNGSGGFGAASLYAISDNPTSVSLADANNDGYLDVVTNDTVNDIVYVNFNNGNGTFGSRLGYAVGQTPSAVAFADMNGDSFVDIVVNNHDSQSIEILLNNANGTFSPSSTVSFAGGGRPQGLAVHDVNNDGKPDVIATDGDGASMGILFGSGSSVVARNSLSVAPVSGDDTALYIQAATGQTSDLLRVVQATGTTPILSLSGTGSLLLRNTTDSTTALQLQNSAGENIVTADTQNGYLGIGTATPGNRLSVNTPTTVDTAAEVVIAASTSAKKGLVIQAADSQVANLFELQDAQGNALSGFASEGQMFLGRASALAGSAKFLSSAGSGSVTLISANPGSTDYTLTLPAENGTVCTTGSVCAGYASTTTNNFVKLAPSAVQVDSTNDNSIYINKTSASGKLLDLQRGGVSVVTISNTGSLAVNAAGSAGVAEKLRVGTPTTVDDAANSIFSATDAASKVVVVQAAASQTANLQEWQSSAGTTLASISKIGSIALTGGPQLTLVSDTVGSGKGVSGSNGISLYNYNGTVNLTPGENGGVGFVNTISTSAINAITTTLTTGKAASVVAAVKGASSQTGDLLQFQNSSGTVLSGISANGVVYAGASSAGTSGTVEKLRVGTPTTVDNATNAIIGTSATTAKGLVIQGVSSQSANLQEWQNSAGTVLASVGASGATLFKNSANSTSAFQIQDASSTSILNVDTTSGATKISIGGAASSTPTLLVVGQGSGSNPTGTAGAIYYNTTSNKFRCFQAGAWTDCIGTGSGAGTGDVINGGNAVAATMVVGTTTAFDLNLITNSNNRLSLANSGAITLQGGPANTTGNGGAINITAQAGGSAAANNTGTGGAINITAGAGSANNNQGGALTLSSGAGHGAQPAGTATLQGGVGGSSSAGGAVAITGGDGGSTTGSGGAITIATGSAVGSSSNNNGGALTVTAGSGAGTGNGGSISVTAGTAASSGNGGALTLKAGASTGGFGGATLLQGGNSLTSGVGGGNLTLAGGQGTGAGSGGDIYLQIAKPGGGGLNALSTVGTISGSDGSVLFKNAVNSTTALQVQNVGGTTFFDLDSTNGRVGIGTAAPGAALEVTGNVLLSTGADRTLSVATSTTGNGNSLTIQAGNPLSTSYVGGALNLLSGTTGNTGGAINVTTGTGLGASGALNLTTGNAGVSGGVITLQTGSNTATGFCPTGVSTCFSNVSINASGGRVNIGASGVAAKLSVINAALGTNYASDVVILGRGAAGQTGNLLTLQDSTPTTLLSVDSTGAVMSKTNANSTTAFQIQNSSSTPIFTADTTNSRLYVGNTSADSTGTLLVLDVKNTTGDPTGTTGAMYYNSFTNKFRCYENGAWANCVGGAGGDVINGGNAVGATMNIGSTTAYDLNLITDNTTRIRIGSAGDVSVNSTGTVGTVEKFRVNTPTTIDNSTSTILASGSSGAKALVLQGAASQTADLLQFQSSNGNVIAGFNAGGNLYLGKASTNTGQIQLFNASGSGSITLTTANPGSSSYTLTLPAETGTICTTATVCAGYASGSSNNFVQLAPSSVQTDNTGYSSININKTSGSGALLTLQNSGTTVASLSNSGALYLKNTTDSTTALQVQSSYSNSPVLSVDTVNARVGINTATAPAAALEVSGDIYLTRQAARTIKVDDSTTTNANGGDLSIAAGAGNGTGSGGALTLMAGAGTLHGGSVNIAGANGTTPGAVNIYGGNDGGGTYGAINLNSGLGRVNIGSPLNTATLSIRTSYVSDAGLVVRALSDYDRNLQEWQDANGLVVAAVSPIGDASFKNITQNGYAVCDISNNCGYGYGGPTNVLLLAPTSAQDDNSTRNSLYINKTGASGDIVKLQHNGTDVLNVTRTGTLAINSSGTIGTNEKLRVNTPLTVDNSVAAIIATGDPGNTGLVVQGYGGQTANLQEWQDNNGTLLGAIDGSGNASFNNITQNGNTVCDDSNNCSYADQGSFDGLVNALELGFNLQGVYNLSADPTIILGNGVAGAQGIAIRDNATPIGVDLLSVTNNDGTVAYFKVDANGVVITGNQTVTGGDLNVATGALKVAGTTRLDNSGNLLNVTYNGNTVGVGYGGTGATTLTSNGVLFGNGTGAIQATAAGLNGQCLVASTGAAPGWGSCADSGGDVNQGGNSYGTAMTIGTSDNYGLNLKVNNHTALAFSNTAQATFQNASDSTTAFQVQNAAGTNLFSIDSTNNRIYVGNATPDSIGTLLVLDNKNTSGDPTGIDGAMYYNSNLGKFRCYENGSWKDCIYGVQSVAKSANQTFSSASYADVSDLSFSVLANKVYKLQCSLLVSVASATNGGNISTNGPAGFSQYTASFAKSLDQSAGDNFATSSTYDDTSAGTNFKISTTTSGASRFILNFNALLVNGANSGTWSLRSKAFDGSSSITIYANSSCDLKPI